MKIKFAIVGSGGYWGKHYVRILSEHPDIELVAVCDTNNEALKKIVTNYPYVQTESNIDDLIKFQAFDAAIVCTPVTTHYEIVTKLLFSGKNVLCEKALTARVNESTLLVASAKKFNKILAVGHTFIYNSCVQHIKKLLDEKSLGEIYYVAMTRVGMSPVRQDVNALWDLGAHDISMLIHWFGMPTSVSSQGNSYLKDGIEDVVFTNLEFENGILANIKNSWINPVKRRYVTIVGSEKMLVFDDIEKTVTTYNKDGTHDHTGTFRDEPLKEQVNDFIESIQQNRKPKVTGEDGLNVVRVLESAQMSLKMGGSEVKIGTEFTNKLSIIKE